MKEDGADATELAKKSKEIMEISADLNEQEKEMTQEQKDRIAKIVIEYGLGANLDDLGL